MSFLKKFFFRGQVSAEALVAILFVLILLGIVIGNNYSMSSYSSGIAESFSDKLDCLRLGLVISEVFANGSGSKTVLELSHDASVFGSQKLVRVNEEFCFFLAPVSDYSLSKGIVFFENVDGNVFILQ
jgi:hypothetical protein